MQALVVLAHPLSDSLCAHLAHEAIDALRSRGATVDVLDLYAEDFQPALTPAERRLHYKTPEPGPEVVALQQRLATADMLVLVFPTWWFSMPAMLKGWFDRVWAPKFAFEHGTPDQAAADGAQILPRRDDPGLALVDRRYRHAPAGETGAQDGTGLRLCAAGAVRHAVVPCGGGGG